MSTAAKRQIGIEQLLQWTYLDELPKRQISSAEGIWDRLAQYGSLGGVNPDPGGSGNAQRYAQFGLPHPDAETIEKAVGALGRAPFDWKNNFELVAGDLAALVTINEVQQAPRSYALPFKSHDMIVGDSGFGPRQLDGTTLEEFSYVREHHEGKLRKGLRIKPGRYAPRDVLLVNSVNLSALVTTHAVKRSRPDWRTEQMRPIPMLAERSQLAMVIGKCKAKNLYTTGSYCPLRWSPSPVEVALARADYLMWHQALVTLAQTLRLTDHEPLMPDAPTTPWIENALPKALPKRTHRSQRVASYRTLPLKPQREKAGPPLRKFNKTKGRRLTLDVGS